MDGVLLLLDGYVLVSLPIDLSPPPQLRPIFAWGVGEYWTLWTGAGFD